jgi:hypothetical protein
MVSGAGMENLAERSGPKRHTLIEHYKGSLTCMECGIVYTRVPIMVYDQAFLLWPDYPPTTYKRASPYPPPGFSTNFNLQSYMDLHVLVS